MTLLLNIMKFDAAIILVVISYFEAIIFSLGMIYILKIPVWMFPIIVFTGAFLGLFFASVFFGKGPEDDCEITLASAINFFYSIGFILYTTLLFVAFAFYQILV